MGIVVSGKAYKDTSYISIVGRLHECRVSTFSVGVGGPLAVFSFLFLHQARHVLANIFVTMIIMRRAFQGLDEFLGQF